MTKAGIDKFIELGPNKVLTGLVKKTIKGADAKNIEIRCDVPDDLTAKFDLRWTAEAVGNILDNAVKYSPDRSEISISACAYDMFVRIDIADNGCGIAEDELAISGSGSIAERMRKMKKV